MARFYGARTGPYGGPQLGGGFGGGGVADPFIGSNTNTGAATSIDVALPAGTSTGDVMFAVLSCTTASPTLTTPAGWTLLHTEFGVGQDVEMYYKVATSGDTPGTNVNFLASASANLTAGIAVFRGVTTPNAGATYSDATSDTAHSLDASAQSPTGSALVVLLSGWELTSVTFTPPAGYTQAFVGFGNGAGVWCAYKSVGAGSIGVLSWTSSLSVRQFNSVNYSPAL